MVMGVHYLFAFVYLVKVECGNQDCHSIDSIFQICLIGRSLVFLSLWYAYLLFLAMSRFYFYLTFLRIYFWLVEFLLLGCYRLVLLWRSDLFFLDFRLSHWLLSLCMHLLWRLLWFCLWRRFLLSQARGGLFSGLQAKSLYAVENSPDDRFWIEPMNFLMEPSLGVMDGRVGEGCTFHVLHAMLRVPCAVEVIYAEAPLFLMLQLVDHLLQVATVHAMRRKVLDYLEGRFVIEHELRKLCIRDQPRIRLVPLLTHAHLGQHGQCQQEYYPHPQLFCLSHQNEYHIKRTPHPRCG